MDSQVLGAFYNLKRGVDTTNATTIILHFLENPDSIRISIETIKSGQHKEISAYIALNVGKAISTHYNEQYLDDQRADIFSDFLELSIYPENYDVRRFFFDYAASSCTSDFIDIILEFIEEHSGENASVLELATVANLYVVSSIYSPQSVETYASLLDRIILYEDTFPRLAMLNLVLKIDGVLDDQGANFLQFKYFELALLHFTELLKSEDNTAIKQAREGFIYAIQAESRVIHYHRLLEFCTTTIQDDTIPSQSRYNVVLIAIKMLKDIPDIPFIEAKPLLKAFYIYSLNTFEENNTTYTPEDSLFIAFTEKYGEKEEYITTLMKYSNKVETDAPGVYVILDALNSLFEYNKTYAITNGKETLELLLAALTSELPALVLIGSITVSNLVETCPEFFNESYDELLKCIFDICQEAPTAEAITALFALVSLDSFNAENFGDILECSLAIVNDQDLQNTNAVFRGLEVTTKKHPNIIEQDFDAIKDPLIELLNDESTTIKASVISLLSALASACPALFEDMFNDFVQFVLECIDNQDPDLSYAAIHGLSSMVNLDSFEPHAKPIYTTLFRMATVDIQPFLADNSGFLKEEESTAAVLDQQMRNCQIAFKVCCQICVKHFQDAFPTLVQALDQLSKEMSYRAMEIYTNSACILISGLKDSEALKEQANFFVNFFTLVIDKTGDPEAIHDSFEGVADLISYKMVDLGQLDRIIEVARDAFEFKLPMNLLVGEVYDSEVHDAGQLFLRQMLFAYTYDCVEQISPFFEIFFNFLNNNDFKELSVSFFADALNLVPDAFNEWEPIFETALKLLKKTCGLEFMKSAAKRLPKLVEENWKKLREILLENIQQDDDLEIRDVSTTTLFAVISNAEVEFNLGSCLEAILKAIPAQSNVEENPEMIDFFEYIVEQGIERPELYFRTMVRLFTDSIGDLENYYFVSNENIVKMLGYMALFYQKISNQGQIINEETGGDEEKLNNVVNALNLCQMRS